MENNPEVQPAINQQIKENIKTNLFSGERYQIYPEKSRDRIAQIITSHTIRIAELLELDPNEVNFAVLTEDRAGKGKTNNPTLNIELNEEQKPTFSILLPPDGLEAYLKLSNNPITSPIVEEVAITELAHELHHIKQFKKNRSAAMKSAESALQEKWQYLSDEGEIAARMFAINYASNRNIPLYKIHQQNTRLMSVLGQLAVEGYNRVRGKTKR